MVNSRVELSIEMFEFLAGIALKKVEAKEAQENGKGQGLSDVATILARRVAVEFSDSDDCPSDSEYDSDDWGKENKCLFSPIKLDFF